MGILSVIPGFLFTEDDFFAKYASGKKILKNRHVKRLVQKRHHKYDDRKKGKPSPNLKAASRKASDGKKNTVENSYNRSETNNLWRKKLDQELLEVKDEKKSEQ